MPKLVDLKGQTFGHWTVLERGENARGGNARWWCQCHCERCDGVIRLVWSTSLRSGMSRSCGGNTGYTRHGHTLGGKRSPTYVSWKGIRQRCANPNNTKWTNYGGRGVSYDLSWDDFAVFLAEMGPRPAGTTLDRIDNNKLTDGYSKSNCRWATATEQRANQRNNTTRAGVGCVIDDCEKPHCARGWCRFHYYRWWTNGDPLTQSERKRDSLGRFTVNADKAGAAC
jgi:hypothetical protein